MTMLVLALSLVLQAVPSSSSLPAPAEPPLSALVAIDSGSSPMVVAEASTTEINATLDRMHEAASKADGPTYFAQFAPDARFIGTDVSERWDIAAFKAYTEPYFAKGQGWTYHPRDRVVQVHGDMAWFDEVLDNDSYGVVRGSGVLSHTTGGWKIEQYVLSFTVPNDRAKAVVGAIRGDTAP